MADAFIGEIRPVPYNFAPRDWAYCEGQLLPINQNSALFSLLGTTYGGDGRTTFGLPNLESRVPLGAGSGPGLTSHQLGQKSGIERILLQPNELPVHSHDVNVATLPADAFDPETQLPALSPREVYGTTKNSSFASGAVTPAGGGQDHENRQPLMVISYVIALFGTFPSRN